MLDVDMRMVAAGVTTMGVVLPFDINRHHDEATMTHAALGDHMLCNMLDLSGLSAQDRDTIQLSWSR